MALLTAEDVLNKAFSKTKYREGFDQDEVDDFLDEVANTIAALTAERDDLAYRLSQAQAGVAVAPAAALAPASGAMPANVTAEGFLAAATDPNPPSATSMLAMAQKLHDEYLSAGEAERDKIIAEAHTEADKILQRAEADARGRMDSLEGERADLERKIDDLRRFERDYRGHLKNYLENLLGDLEHGAQKGTGAIPTTAAPVNSPAPPASASVPAASPVTSPGTRTRTTTPNDEPTGSLPEIAPRPATPQSASPASQPLPQWPTA
jgi:DivIVA domain-containing protein